MYTEEYHRLAEDVIYGLLDKDGDLESFLCILLAEIVSQTRRAREGTEETYTPDEIDAYEQLEKDAVRRIGSFAPQPEPTELDHAQL